MVPDGSSMVGLIMLLVVIGGLAWAIPSLVGYLRRREADRKELLDLMREQNRRQ